MNKRIESFDDALQQRAEATENMVVGRARASGGVPEYYGSEEDPYEALKVIEAWGLGFGLGSVLKYIRRHGRKPGADAIADLRKAQTYIAREVQRLEKIKAAKSPAIDPATSFAAVAALDSAPVPVSIPALSQETLQRIRERNRELLVMAAPTTTDLPQILPMTPREQAVVEAVVESLLPTVAPVCDGVFEGEHRSCGTTFGGGQEGRTCECKCQACSQARAVKGMPCDGVQHGHHATCAITSVGVAANAPCSCPCLVCHRSRLIARGKPLKCPTHPILAVGCQLCRVLDPMWLRNANKLKLEEAERMLAAMEPK